MRCKLPFTSGESMILVKVVGCLIGTEFNLMKFGIPFSLMSGCDVTTGECKTVPDTSEDDAGLSLGTKVMIGVVAGITLLVVLPALYAMYNMRIENRQRNARLRSHMELERMTQQAYIGKRKPRQGSCLNYISHLPSQIHFSILYHEQP